MRILTLQNFAEIDIPQNLEDGQERKWMVVGASSSKLNRHLFASGNPRARRIQVILHDSGGKELAGLDIQTLEITTLDTASKICQKCTTIAVNPDGQAMFGMERSGTIVALCRNLERGKSVRQPVEMKYWKKTQAGLMTRLTSSVRDLLGYQTRSELQDNLLAVQEALFPILGSSSNGLGLICMISPCEVLVFSSMISMDGLKHKNISTTLGKALLGRWYKVCMDEVKVQNWLMGKGIPVVLKQVDYTKERKLHGAIAYVAFVENRLEMLYGVFEMVDSKQELKWGQIKYEFDWVIMENRTEVGKINFIAALSLKGDKVAIAFNTYMGVYVIVQDLERTDSDSEVIVKVERVTVPLCSHSDYDKVVIYDEKCWISCIEWLSDDCYFACTTRCGCLSIFHKTGETMVLHIRKHEDPAMDPACDFYHQILDIRGSSELRDNVEMDPTVQNRVKVKWSGLPENVLIVSCDTKMCLFDVKWVDNYIKASEICIPGPRNISNIGMTASKLPLNGGTKSNCKDSGNSTFTNDLNSNNAGYDRRDLFENFAKNLPQAEIILRPVVVMGSEANKNRQSMIRFKFHDKKGRNRNNFGPKFHSDDKLYLTASDSDGKDLGNKTLSLPDLDAEFELAAPKRSPSPPQYMADDEMTDVESKERLDRLDTPEPQFRPEYPDEYHKQEEFPVPAKVIADSELDGGAISDNSYSPPFTDDEDGDNYNDLKPRPGSASSQNDQRPSLCMLPMPNIPRIDSVIPFVSRIADDDELDTFSITPGISKVCVTSSTQTEYDEYTHVNECGPRCRPVCVITEPPTPTKSPSQTYSPGNTTTDGPQPADVINNIEDDQLDPLNLEEIRGLDESRYLEHNNDINENESKSRNKCASKTSDEDLQAMLLNLAETSILPDAGSPKTEDSSRKIWEQVAGRFDKKPSTRKNKPRQLPATVSVGTSPSLNFIVETEKKLGERERGRNQDNLKPENGASAKDILRSILKLSTITDPPCGQDLSVQKTTVVIGKPTHKILTRKSLPTDATDIGLLEHLKDKLHSLKRTQDEFIPHRRSDLSKFLFDWMNSASNQPFTAEDKEQLMAIKQQDSKRLQAVSTPNFETEMPKTRLKKVTFSVPELSLKPRPSPNCLHQQTEKCRPKIQSGSNKSKSIGLEFTIGPPTKQVTVDPSKPKATKVLQLNTNAKAEVEGRSRKPKPVIKPIPPVSVPMKVFNKMKIPAPSKIGNLVPISKYQFVISKPSPRTSHISKSSAEVTAKPKQARSQTDLRASQSLSANHIVSKKSHPTIPVKKRSNSIEVKKKPLVSKMKTGQGSLRPMSAEQGEEDIREFKTKLKKLAKTPAGRWALNIGTKFGKCAAKQIRNRSLSPGQSSTKTSSNSSQQSSAKPSRSPSRSPVRSPTMEELKGKMIEALRIEIQRSGKTVSFSEGSETDGTEDDDTDDSDVRNHNTGKALTIQPEVLEDVPLRSVQSQIIGGEDDDDDDDDDEDEDSGSPLSDTVQRRVSFSNPIAVFKTMSPPTKMRRKLTEDDLETLRLRRLEKEIFDF